MSFSRLLGILIASVLLALLVLAPGDTRHTHAGAAGPPPPNPGPPGDGRPGFCGLALAGFAPAIRRVRASTHPTGFAFPPENVFLKIQYYQCVDPLPTCGHRLTAVAQYRLIPVAGLPGGPLQGPVA